MLRSVANRRPHQRLQLCGERELRFCKSQGHSVAMDYIKSAASTTDNMRPVSQQMISDATNDYALL